MTHVPIILQECLEVVVIPEHRVRGQSLKKHLMHGHRLLEGGQVLPEEGRGGEEEVEEEEEEEEEEKRMRRRRRRKRRRRRRRRRGGGGGGR